MTSKSYTPGSGVAATSSVEYTYDGASGCNQLGRLASATSGNQVNNYPCYYWTGMPTSSSQVTGGATYSMSYGYNLAGKPTSFTFPSLRQQTIKYDSAGRVSGVTGANGTPSYASLTSSDAYFPNGGIRDLRLGPNALVQQYCQNNRLQTVGIRQAPLGGGTTGACANSGTGSSGDPLNLATTYGVAGANNGNMTAETIQTASSGTWLNVTQNFTYDAYDRLLTASEGANWSQNYGYDAYGNRWVSSGYLPNPKSTPTASTDFNASNQLVATMAAGGTNTYDPGGSGKLIGTNGSTFSYDAENRQVAANVYNSASSNWASSTGYVYDGEGRRVQKLTCSPGANACTSASATSATTYVYDAEGNLVAEYGSPSSDTGTMYLAADHLGSTRMMTGPQSTAYHDYLPFGEEIPGGIGGRGILYGETDDPRQKFTGKERDSETGLDYFGARYMSSAQGRFTSPDPLLNSGRPNNPQSWNRYGYALNNPLRYTDPYGLWTWGTCSGSQKECQSYRLQFEAGVNQARKALASGKLSKQEQNYLGAVLDYLGSATDKKGPKVDFGAVKGAATGVMTGDGIRIDMAKLDRAFSSGGNEVNEIGATAVHETKHQMDLVFGKFDFNVHTETEERKEADLYLFFLAEQRAYGAESFVFKGLDADDRSGLWNPSWREADKETLRKAGVKEGAARSVAQIRDEIGGKK